MTTQSRHKALGSYLLVALLLVAPGCSLAASSMQTVAIQASDPEAEIFVDGNYAGVGAITIDLKRNKSHGVTAKVGKRTGTAVIGRQISETGGLDIVGGILFLIPFIGIFGPGFWSLDTDSITVVIPPPPVQG